MLFTTSLSCPSELARCPSLPTSPSLLVLIMAIQLPSLSLNSNLLQGQARAPLIARAHGRVSSAQQPYTNTCCILSYLYSSFLTIWGPSCVACEILVSQPGFKPSPFVLGIRSLNHWTTRDVPTSFSKLRHSKTGVHSLSYLFF